MVADEWWPLVPLVAGYAVARTVGGTLKWPNDVLLDDRKLCGILVERVHARTPLAVVGIGINVDQTADELPVPTATSLSLAGRARDRTELLGVVLLELRRRLAVLVGSPDQFVAGYRALCETLGRQVRVELPSGDQLLGVASDVDEHGRLVVTTADGDVPVAAGDVEHVRAGG